MGLEIALVEPEIPQNTGNIIRTCVALGASLHLVGKLGFSLEDRYLKRSGLDYWYNMTDLYLWDNVEDLLKEKVHYAIYYTSTKGTKVYSEPAYEEDTLILFGKETKGLPEPLLLAHPERMIRIPMIEGTRSLNLSNSVAIVAYEYARQQNFKGLGTEGHLRGLN
jgi:tRNA (cytidine/uridine-2'-O-)-methyltransferase